MNCMSCEFGHTYGPGCLARQHLAPKPDPVADVYLHTKNGVLKFEDVRPDSIGPAAEHPGVIGVEFNSGDIEIAHVPWVEWWHIEYR